MADALWKRFDELRRAAPGAEAIVDVDGRRALSRDELAGLVDACAPAVRSSASEAGVVAVQSANAPELIATVLAAWRDGLVALPIDRERSIDDVEALAAALGLSVVLRGADLVPHRCAPSDVGLDLAEGTCLLKLTSGSTGEPRAVAVGEDALVRGIAQICSTMGIGPGDRNLATLPLAHSYGFDNVLGALACVGVPAVLVSDLVPRRLFTVVRETGVTVWPGVPLLLDLLTRSGASGEGPLGALRLVISAGAPLPAATREAFARRFGLRPRTFYGATECGGIAFDREGTPDVPEGCVGAPLDGVAIDLVDVEDGVGRVRVRSASVASGTHPRPTTELACGRLLASDLGRIDERGRLHLLGRVGEFVKIHGHKVHPVEVERVIRSLPGVRDVAVVPYERSHVSEGLRAILVVEPGVDRARIVRGCEAVLPPYKVPRSIELCDELPRNERGKLDRRRLRGDRQ